MDTCLLDINNVIYLNVNTSTLRGYYTPSMYHVISEPSNSFLLNPFPQYENLLFEFVTQS